MLTKKDDGVLGESLEEAVDVSQVVEDGRRDADVAVGNADVDLGAGQALANVLGIANDEADNRRG